MTYISITPEIARITMGIDGAAHVVKRSLSGSFTTSQAMDMAHLAAVRLQTLSREIEDLIIQLRQSEAPTCASPQAPVTDGNGGSEPSQVIPFRFTKMSLKPGSIRSASFVTANTHEALSYRPAFGGSPARSTPTPEN